jgi:hypothetical protein
VKLQVQPFTSGKPLIDVFTTVRAKEGRGCNGIAWFLSSDELSAVESVAAKTRSLRIWPLPLALASRLPGDGIGVCVLKDAICSMLFESGFPSLYRIIPKGRRSPEDEIEWIRTFARSRGTEDLATEMWEDSDDPDARARLEAMALETLSGRSFGTEINLSLRAVDTVLALERGIRLCTRVAHGSASGGVRCGGRLSQQIFSQRALERIRNQSVALYRSVFDPTGRSLIRSVRREEAQRGARREKGLILEEMLARLGASAKAAGESSVLIESLRYNAEGSDLLGSVPDMENSRRFRRNCPPPSGRSLEISSRCPARASIFHESKVVSRVTVFSIPLDTPGLKRLLSVAFLCVASWGCYFFLSESGRSDANAVTLQKRRFETLLRLSQDYIAIGGGTQTKTASEDPITAISKAMDTIDSRRIWCSSHRRRRAPPSSLTASTRNNLRRLSRRSEERAQIVSAELKAFSVGRNAFFPFPYCRREA